MSTPDFLNMLAGQPIPADTLAAPLYLTAELSVWGELTRSLIRYPRAWKSMEEAAMVLGEEVDELWDDVRTDQLEHARIEAAQAGAMALRFIADLYAPPCASAGRRCWAAMAEQRAARTSVGPGRLLVSGHEGFGFVRREFDALWSAVRFDDPARPAAARVAAAAVRFIAEIGGGAVSTGRVSC